MDRNLFTSKESLICWSKVMTALKATLSIPGLCHTEIGVFASEDTEYASEDTEYASAGLWQ